MRPRIEILTEVQALVNKGPVPAIPAQVLLSQLEVLLDIRELLDSRPSVTHPASPPPPEVKR